MNDETIIHMNGRPATVANLFVALMYWALRLNDPSIRMEVQSDRDETRYRIKHTDGYGLPESQRKMLPVLPLLAYDGGITKQSVALKLSFIKILSRAVALVPVLQVLQVLL